MTVFPRITVVTPSFNQAKYIRETIESVLRQRYPNLEYFVVDGGSTDGSVDIIREYESAIDWWVSEPDEGQSDALRKGFARATGDLIGWLNSDDVYFPEALLRVGRAYQKNPRASIYAGGHAIGGLNDGPIARVVIPSSTRTWLHKYGILAIGQQSSLYSRRIYEQIGGIDRRLHIRMDADLWYRLLRCQPIAETFDGMVGFIRWHDETKTSNGRDIYRSELDTFIRSLGLSRSQYSLLLMYYRLRRLFSLTYPKSGIVTLQLRGKTMLEIWSQHERELLQEKCHR